MTISQICSNAKAASYSYRTTAEDKNLLLEDLARGIENGAEVILSANAIDVANACAAGQTEAFIDRLALNAKRIKGIAEGIRALIALPDPVGEVVKAYALPSGLSVQRIRVPLGVIGIIFEARPNVAADAVALCLKSGNGVILRGSRDSANSVAAIVRIIKQALANAGINPDLCGNIEGDREATKEMLSAGKSIDVVIPRGGENLKKFVLAHATMPVIASAGGNCHIYVAPSADYSRATEVILNAKLSRPSTCNALETLLIDRAIAAEFTAPALSALAANGVKIYADIEVLPFYVSAIPCGEQEFYNEYNDLIIKVKLISGVEQAVEHINKYSTGHSDAIISIDKEELAYFADRVDSAAVYINASTRFTDGYELGLGAEMGISTQKLHVRGPIGLEELTCVKYVVSGDYAKRG